MFVFSPADVSVFALEFDQSKKKKDKEPCLEAPQISEMHLYFPCETVCCEEKGNINVNLFSYTDWDGWNKGRDVHGPSRLSSDRCFPPEGAICSFLFVQDATKTSVAVQ